MAHENSLHVTTPQYLQLDPQPLHMFVARLRLGLATIHRAVRVEKVHRVETDHRQATGDYLRGKPPTQNKGMALVFRNESAPDLREALRPFVGALFENIVRHDIVISKSGDHWNGGLAESANPFLRQVVVQFQNLVGSAGEFFVVVMPGGVASPNHKINLIFQIFFDPAKGLVDE